MFISFSLQQDSNNGRVNIYIVLRASLVYLLSIKAIDASTAII